MKGDSLSWDYLLVPVSLCVGNIPHLATHHSSAQSHKTVIGLNSAVRKQWVFSMMADPMKNGVLIIQTLRNIMASSLLATTAITLSSVISVFVSTSSSSTSDSTVSQQLVYTINQVLLHFALLFLGFLCNVQSTRYFAHSSFLATLPTGKDKTDYIEYVSTTVNRGSYFWSFGFNSSLSLDLGGNSHVCLLLHNDKCSLFLGQNDQFYTTYSQPIPQRGRENH